MKIIAEVLCFHEGKSQFVRKLQCLYLLNHAVITGDIVISVAVGPCPHVPDSKCKGDILRCHQLRVALRD